MARIKLLLVDRARLFRGGVCSVLATEEDIEVAGEAESEEQALSLIENRSADVMLLDIDLPHSFVLADRVNWHLPAVPVIFLAEDEDDLFRAIRYGAAAYVTRSVSSGALVDVIRKVCQGGCPASESLLRPDIASMVLQEFTAFAKEETSGLHLLPLSPQQDEILRQVLENNSGDEIADAMGTTYEGIQSLLASTVQRFAANARTYDIALGLRDRLTRHRVREGSPSCRDFMLGHLVDALRAATAEVQGAEDLAERLRAQARLRLVTMSDDELWELARLTSSPPNRSTGIVYEQIKEAVREHQASASEWKQHIKTC